MLPFVILLFLPIVVQHIAIQHYSGRREIDVKRKNQAALFVFFALYTILLMFRHETVGIDTRNYIKIFGRISNLNWSQIGKSSAESGFSYFNKIISLFTEDAQAFFMVTAIVTVAIIYSSYRRVSADASLTIVLFCAMPTFVMAFSGIRQMLAIGIGFWAHELTRKKKLIPFILIVVFAMTFHTSAFILFFMYPLFHVKITKKWLYFIVPILATIFVFNRPIFSFLGWILTRYTKYDASVTETGAYAMLVLFVLLAIFAFLVPDESILDQETIGMRNYLLLSVVLQMFAPLHTIAMRINYYYIIFIPLLLPRIIACRSEQWKQVAVLSRYILLVFFMVYFFVNTNDKGNLNVFPYHFFWETV